MSLKSYYVDAKRLALEERTALLDRVDSLAFITSVDMNNIGCFIVYWDLETDIRKTIEFPQNCVVTDC